MIECAAFVLRCLGSLKLTVTLLAMSMFLVFAGTVAQVDSGIWSVVDQYFRCWFARVDCRVFFPRSWEVAGRFLFPGGWLIGTALVVNLLVSHSQRIQVKARGRRLFLGIAVLAVGSALTWLAISHVFDVDSSAEKADPFWRVTFQLIQGAGVAAVLFMGCRMVFDRKAGIVLLHAGIVLMMASELLTAGLAKEGQMSISEGDSSDFVEDNRSVELAVVSSDDPALPKDKERVVAIPESRLRSGRRISSPDLPFDIDIPAGRFFKNAQLVRPKHGAPNPATTGAGLQWVAEARSEESGASSAARVDQSAVYATFLEKEGGRPIGTYLLSVLLTFSDLPQTIQVGSRSYDLTLRFERTHKPYTLYLHDFQFNRYVGTNTPKDYSSYVRLLDPERGVDRDVRIWMNNPLRYRGDTLYQSSFDGATETTTHLQVVSNAGWMVPYVA